MDIFISRLTSCASGSYRSLMARAEMKASRTRKTSMRYGGGGFDARLALIRVLGFLQRKKIVVLDSNPELCGEILAASDTKGSFLEYLIATPAWRPIYSIESMDGEFWEQLSGDFKKLMNQLNWRERLAPLSRRYAQSLAESVASENRIVDSEAISRLVVRILFELLFDQPLSAVDETLFFQASLEWRKEVAVKGKANPLVKSAFFERLSKTVADSRFNKGLDTYKSDPASWISLFAQPFLISPQINISDIFVTVFHYLRVDRKRLEQAKSWASDHDRAKLDGIILESIRLRHPFPILERELKKDLVAQGVHYPLGTQFFILLDQFKQDQTFNPERWLKAPGDNPYYSIPFAAGPRMCVGKPIAMELLVELLKSLLLLFPDESIQPQQGHLYSGRDNDGQESIAESRYQIGVFARLLWKSFRIGREKNNEASLRVSPGCPWKKATSRFR